jgi:hypothetical protein
VLPHCLQQLAIALVVVTALGRFVVNRLRAEPSCRVFAPADHTLPLAELGRLSACETAVDGGPMTEVGVGETTEVCEECGAVVGDRERHTQWHERLAAVLSSPDQ